MSGRNARLAGLATAVPPHVLRQEVAAAATAELFRAAMPDVDRLMPVFANSGIERRFSARPIDWHLAAPGFAARNAAFVETAETLLLEAAELALERAGVGAEQIDAVIAVSSTGIATPSLEARIGDRLGLRGDVERTPVFGLGCAGGILGFARAASLAVARPGSKVLLLVVELCSLAFRLNDLSKANLVACALFGDGAAAVVLSTDADGPEVAASGERRWPGTLDVMGWTIEDDGLGVLFSISVPDIARREMRAAADAFLAAHGGTREEVDRWICHPGGTKVVEALESALQLPSGRLADSRSILRDYGNMSAPTVLFVLERALAEPGWRTGVMTALGPGFSAGFVRLAR